MFLAAFQGTHEISVSPFKKRFKNKDTIPTHYTIFCDCDQDLHTCDRSYKHNSNMNQQLNLDDNYSMYLLLFLPEQRVKKQKSNRCGT